MCTYNATELLLNNSTGKCNEENASVSIHMYLKIQTIIHIINEKYTSNQIILIHSNI